MPALSDLIFNNLKLLLSYKNFVLRNQATWKWVFENLSKST